MTPSDRPLSETIRPPGAGADLLARRLLDFAHSLRAAGLEIGSAQTAMLLQALESIDLRDRDQVRAAVRATLAGRRGEAEWIDALFARWLADLLGTATDPARPRQRRRDRLIVQHEAAEGGAAETLESDAAVAARRASDRERLRHKDFADLSDAERRTVLEILRDQPLRLPDRRLRRRRRHPSGPIDLRGVLREAVRHGGEVVRLPRRVRRTAPRPLVALCDVSGSMEAHARVLLPFLFTLRGASNRLEVFAFGTRLTRLTRELRHHDPDRALTEATARIVDWGGGTRIGASLASFHQHWASRTLRGGAVCLMLSDGWDRGDVETLRREAAWLGRSCHRLIWLNPLLGSDGYAPIAPAIASVLPACDAFLPVHNLASLEALAATLRADSALRRALS
ncbi:MAG: VWA domain-containing protein [Acidobacteriota bacterium]